MKKQVYNLSTMFFLGLGAIAFGQQNGTVGINVEAPSATLEIQPSSDNAATNATTNEGILVPKLTKERVSNIANESLVKGTMIYIDGISYSGANNKVSRINADGFYYYDGKLWVKVGDNATFTARLDEALTTNYDWTDGGKGLADFYEFTSVSGTLKLPAPSDYPGAIIHYKNSTGGTINYGGTSGITVPDRTNSITASSAQIVWSDGNKWYLIGGRN
ncbi:hypothetical protein KRX57_07345 [Weeksellaceae bacterium TAE3-ERU29]|nr:hypothetical protein [Weeksellaceae bacterium TAE3-ERU29]